MGKRRSDGVSPAEPDNKKRKQGLIHNEQASPIGEDGLSQCFRLVKIRMHVSVAPMFSASPIEGIKKQHLDPMLLQYEQSARGVVIAYKDVKLLKHRSAPQALGKIINESPFSYFWITCTLLVWSPQQGDIVEGWISVQSPGHIALLIHDTFNASIKRADIPENWEFIPQEDDENGSKSLGYWQDSEGRKIDGKLQFTIRKFLRGGRTVLVLGSLLTPDDVVPPHYDGPKTTKHEASHSHAHIETTKPAAVKPKKITFDE